MKCTIKHLPQVSIGMPVYNGENHIRKAIDSLLNQTFVDFELIISDNASLDNTEAICREYELKDKRIKYVRWSVNRGALANFKFVLNESVGEYFMWAACDDIRSADYLEINYNFLIRNPDYVASTSPTRYEDGTFDQSQMGDGSLEGKRSSRILDFFNCWHANARFYSLFRADELKKNLFMEHDYLGSDWSIVLDIVSRGKTKRLDQGYVVLGRSGFSNSGTILTYYRTKYIHYIFPFFELFQSAVAICCYCPVSSKIIVYYKLMKLNIQAIRLSLVNRFKYKF